MNNTDTSAADQSTMQAVVREQYCATRDLSIKSVPRPSAGAGKVVVQVRAASLNPFDWHMVTGKPYLVRTSAGLREPKRHIPGVDVAGVIVEIGADVTSLAPGDEVFGYASGSYAEFAVADADSLIAKPDNVSFAQAAAVPLAGFTAIQALRDKGELAAGEHVLINGAAGGVGTLSVQIAKSFDAHVTAVCSSRNVDMVTRLGADRVVDYTTEDFAADGEQYDLIIDAVGNRSFATMRSVLKPEGRLVQVGGPKGGDWIQPITFSLKGMAAFAFRSQRFFPFLAHESRTDLLALRDLLASGALTPHISERFALADVSQAFDLIASGHAQAKIVLEPTPAT